MATAGRIVAELTAKTQSFDRNMKRSQRITRGFSVGVGRMAKRLVQFGAVAAVAAVTGLTLMVRHQLKAIDTLAKLSRNLGISIDDLRGFRLAAGLAGVETEKFDKALKKMIKSVADAQNGLSTQVRAFEALGLSVKDLEGLDPAEIFRRIADAVKLTGRSTESLAALMDIFGTRIGTDLFNLLAQGREGLDETRRLIDDLGLSLSQVDGSNVEAANDAWLTFKTILDAVAKKFTVAIAPFLTAFVNRLIEAGSEGQKMGQLIDKSLEVVARGIAFIADSIQNMEGIVNRIARFVLRQIVKVLQAAEGLGLEFETQITRMQILINGLGVELRALEQTDWGDEVIKKFEEIREAAKRTGEDFRKVIPDIPLPPDPEEIFGPPADLANKQEREKRIGDFQQVNLRRIDTTGGARGAMSLEKINERQAKLLEQIKQGIDKFLDNPFKLTFD